MADLADYLELMVGQARRQFRELRRRSPVSYGRQVTFLPVETLLLARQYYGRPPLLERLLLPDAAQSPARKYLDWHKTKVFIA